MTQKALISFEDGSKYELPIIKATKGEDAVDVSSLLKQTHLFTYDAGFLSTASCKSSITYIDGDKGILLHRGYKIADLAEKVSFSSLFYALLFGELPKEKEFKDFEKRILEKMVVEEEVKKIILTFKPSSHPMAIMMAAISMLSAKYGANYSPYKEEAIIETAIDTLAKVCATGAYVYRFVLGLAEVDLKVDLSKSFEQNLSNFMFKGTEAEKYIDVVANTINKILILHADHEQNASTSSVRLVASTDVNIYASVVAGFAALWGPLHGGANEAVINMLKEIGDVKNIPLYVEKAKDKNSNFRLMGFGHRVYKNYDPRASVLKSSCDTVLEKLHSNQNNILSIAKELEKIALSDSYFKERKLFPNVDFYSGIIYKALGMPSSFFTVIFGMGRTAGWVAQVKEAMADEAKKISRPRQVYVGNTERTF